jgi:hypothetical protein
MNGNELKEEEGEIVCSGWRAHTNFVLMSFVIETAWPLPGASQ